MKISLKIFISIFLVAIPIALFIVDLSKTGVLTLFIILVIGFFMWKPKYLFSMKKIREVQEFLLELDKIFPPGQLTERLQEAREELLIDSGYTKREIEKAQKLVSKKETDFEVMCEWFEKAESNGHTLEKAMEILIYNGWNKRLVKKAYNQNKKIQNGRKNKGKDFPEITESERKSEGEIDRTDGETDGRSEGIERGTESTDGSRRNGEVKHKRLLPKPTLRSISPSLHRSESDKPKPEWDWEAVKSSR